MLRGATCRRAGARSGRSTTWKTSRSCNTDCRPSSEGEATMRYMIIVKGSKDTERGAKPTKKLIDEMASYHEELAKAGALLDGSGLHPSSKGWRVRYDGARRTVIDG